MWVGVCQNKHFHLFWTRNDWVRAKWVSIFLNNFQIVQSIESIERDIDIDMPYRLMKQKSSPNWIDANFSAILLSIGTKKDKTITASKYRTETNDMLSNSQICKQNTWHRLWSTIRLIDTTLENDINIGISSKVRLT